MPYLGGIGELVEINRISAEEWSVEWQIQDFLLLPGGSSDWYATPKFSIGNGCWWLRLYPNRTDETQNPASGWVSLDLYRLDEGPPKTFHLSVGIRGSGGVEKRREGEKEFKRIGSYSWIHFISRSELVEHETRLMPDGVLNITCDVKRVVSDAVGGVLSLPSTQSALTNRIQSSDKRGGEKALEDFAKLLFSGENSDITVQVDDVEFKVHRNIISVRSPVFSAMFNHETEERASNIIKIIDCEPDIFREYLQYLYTGSVHSLTEQTVFGLFHIADKYLADDLKKLCLEHIRDMLSVQTFCKAVKLALTHRESGLFDLAIDFATQNIPLIIRSVEWQDFIQEFPMEANEILIKCIRP